MAGLGIGDGWLFSSEMDVALKHGYKIEIIRGYKFTGDFSFKEYVEKMYSLRQQYPKSHPMNLIAKLLMNSLYGKFGMKSEKTVIECYNNNDPEKYYALQDYLESTKNVIQDIIDDGGFTIIVRNGV